MKDSNIFIIGNIIKILSDGNVHSAKQLCRSVGITLASMYEYVHTLRKWGIEVTTISSNKDYLMSRKIDLLNYESIYSLVRRGNLILKLVINSTNQYLIECLNKLTSGDVCIAEYQTAGRGRHGRHWASPFGCNMYLSLYWQLDQKITTVMGLSLVVGIAIAETLNKLSGNSIKVKWPNDIYLNGKKLAGILIEIRGKNGDNITHAIIGIGLNIAMNLNFATNICQEWINLEQTGIKIERNIIAGQIIVSLRHELIQFEKYGLVHFIKRWLALDNFLHKTVRLTIGDYHKIGIVKGIDERGAILLEQNGSIFSYCIGNISLRSNNQTNLVGIA